jgi:uncharacterized membrane protein
MLTWLTDLHPVLVIIQHGISFLGILIILSGTLIALFQYGRYLFDNGTSMNDIRLKLGRTLILGLEFIVAADLIGTTTTPDYYSVGIVASIVLIRTFLSFTLNKELMTLSKE